MEEGRRGGGAGLKPNNPAFEGWEKKLRLQNEISTTKEEVAAEEKGPI